MAEREHALIRRVEVGMMDEGVQLVRCVPQACVLQFPSGLIPQAAYSDAGPRLAMAWRADRLIRDLDRLLSDGHSTRMEEGAFDAVHAWGAGCWELAAELAEASGAALVVEADTGTEIERAPRFEKSCASVLPEPGGCVWSCPAEPVRDALERAGCRWPARVIPPGVFVPEAARPHRRPGSPASLCIVGGGPRDPAEAAPTVAILEGIAELNRRREAMESAGAGTIPEVLAFLDEALVADQPDVWRMVQRLRLSDCVSVVAELEARREPVLRADILALPHGAAAHRSLLLDAMAAGIPSVCGADPFCPELDHLATAWVIEEPRSRLWTEAVERLLIDTDLANTLGDAARQFVATHRLASSQARAVLELHQHLAGGTTSLGA
ncbi:MAG: glycosyltransferase [Planctomycetes bacterium]|nr:glycosyltransferase [Planctomycetota bacterium]